VKALGRFFRDRVSGSNNFAGGGGAGLAAVLPATKKLDVILEGLAGLGIGRYGDSVGPDVTLRQTARSFQSARCRRWQDSNGTPRRSGTSMRTEVTSITDAPRT